MNFPLIAIQVELIKVNKDYLLNFVKVLDVYEEPDIQEEQEIVNEEYWGKNYEWVLQGSNTVMNALAEEFKQIRANYVKAYIALTYNSRNVISFHKRKYPNFLMEVSVRQCEELVESLKDLLNKNSVPFQYFDPHKRFSFFLNNKNYRASEKPLKELMSRVLREQDADNTLSED